MPVILYAVAVFFWILLLFPYFYTIFTAACFACFSFPLYQKICNYKPGLWAISIYTIMLILIIVIPISIVFLLVTPQALAGYNTLLKIKESNFQLPQTWLDYIDSLKETFLITPELVKWFNEITSNIENILSELVGILVSGGVGVVGSTVNVLWLLFLFVTFSVLGVVYARRLRLIVKTLTFMQDDMLTRFTLAIRGALRGVFLGVLLVAVVQGILCGIGFAVAGIDQPAFWGLLATLVAPIPVVGTALVWVPLCIVLWFSGNIFAAIGLALWGVIAVAGADNIIRPLFLQRGIKAPLFVLLLAILCGLATFGPVGMIIGPMIVAFGIQAIYEADKLSKKD